MIKAIHTDEAPAAIGPYSQAISAPPFLFVSGQIGMNPKTGELAGEELEAQAKQAIENMLAIVKAGGGSVEKIVSVDIFLTDMSRFADVNRIYESYFSSHKPARAAIEVSALPKGACFEIKCVAMVG